VIGCCLAAIDDGAARQEIGGKSTRKKPGQWPGS